MATCSIVIVNYRTPGLVIDCLRSLANEIATGDTFRVYVVENGSGDDSAAKIGKAIADEGWSAWAELMVDARNTGFAGGNNVALKPILANPPDYVLLLNPDTYVRPGAVRALIEFMEQHPKVGIAGSRLEDPDGTPQRSAFRFPTIGSELENAVRIGFMTHLLDRWVLAPPVREEPHECDWLAGASMIVRKAVFDTIGLLDADYFLYYEEVDFCLRARRAGWPCWYVPASRVVHLVGQASGVTDTKKPAKRTPRYWFESRRRYFVKNHGRLYKTTADVAWLSGHVLWRMRRAVQHKPDPDPPHLLADFFRFNFLGR
jgi:GT2 family glycosyltransferase